MASTPPTNNKIFGLEKRTAGIVGGVIGALLVCCCIGTLVLIANNGKSGGGSANATSTSQQSQVVHATSTPARPTATSKPKVWTAVQTFSGNGSKKTGNFSINANDWRLYWSCDPSSSFGGSYNVIVAVAESDGSFGGDPAAVNTICQSGNTGDFTEEHNITGTFYLDVTSEGAWTLKVEVLQ